MTIFDFVQPPNSAFQFSPTLDGQVYNAFVTWNFFAQRYYINLYAINGTRVFTLPLLGSPIPLRIDTATWIRGVSVASIKTLVPHYFPLGATVDLVVSGCSPEEFNGNKRCLVAGPNEVTFPLTLDPGPANVVGSIASNLNIAAGYFAESSLVYREANQQFEVTP